MFELAGKQIDSRFLLGTAQYPSPEHLRRAIEEADCDVITVSLRRQTLQDKANPYFDFLQTLPCHLLPNTAGCFSAQEAIVTAQMARELFNTDWIKVEVMGDEYTLQPDPFELVKAVEVLINDGFKVFPYCTADLVLCQKLVDLGCKILMPWAAPIGSGQGVREPDALRLLRERFPQLTLIVDAGIGKPSDATFAMELGMDAVLLNTAVAKASDPVLMARAFMHAIRAGRDAYEAGIMPKRDFAHASTPIVGKPFAAVETS